MVIRKKYIESLFCAVILELDSNNEMKNKLYTNLCNVINNEGFNILFSEIDFDNNSSYEPFIAEYNNCFDLTQKQMEYNNEFKKKFDIIKELGVGGFGKVFEVKNLLDNS